MQRILLRIVLIAVAVIIAVTAWIVIDLNRAVKVDIRAFDADEVARLDTAMWRSYYSRERVRLFREATELLGEQYHFPFWRRQLVASYAAKSALYLRTASRAKIMKRPCPISKISTVRSSR